MVSQTGISQTMVASISSITQTMVTISSISQDIGISLSLPLGNMDGAGRVSNIATSSSIESSYGRDSSRGQASSGEGGRGRDLGVASSNMVGNRSNMVGGNRSNMVGGNGSNVVG